LFRILTLQIVVDLILVFAAFTASQFLHFFIRDTFGYYSALEQIHFQRIVVFVVLYQAILFFVKIYEKSHIARLDLQLMCIFRASLYWLIVIMFMSYFLKFDPRISRSLITFDLITVPFVLIVWRVFLTNCVRSKSISDRLRSRVLIVGWNPLAERIFAAMQEDEHHSYFPVGYIRTPRTLGKVKDEILCLGNLEDIEWILDNLNYDSVILTDLDLPHHQIVGLANLCEKNLIDFKITPSYFEVLAGGLELELLQGVPVLGVTKLPLDYLANRIFKRVLDLVGGIVGCLLAFPIVLVFGSLVYLESPGPIFYRQRRVGYKGKEIWVTKIRTMKLDAETESGAVWAKKHDNRVLKIGAFMRKNNIDEVPQFLSVILGDMSLVGPRPERPELIMDFKEVVPHYHARHNAIPGLSGWAQINGLRGDTSIVERIRYDVYYLENWSLWLDIYIMIMTFFTRKNAY